MMGTILGLLINPLYWNLIIMFTIFWIIMLVDSIQHKYANDSDKIVWVLVNIFTGFIGALIYYFVYYRKEKSLKWFWITLLVLVALQFLIGLLMVPSPWILIIIIIMFPVFWIIMLIDSIQHKYANDSDKIIWVLVIIFTGFIGALIYYFVYYRKEKSLKWFWITLLVLVVLLLSSFFPSLFWGISSTSPVSMLPPPSQPLR